jgi:hypothetical protein
MPSNNPLLQTNRLLPAPLKKRWPIWWLVATLGLVIIGVIWFWPKGSGCVIDDPKIYTKEPAISHFFTGEEGLRYRLNDGKLIPFNDSKALAFNGKTYEIHISVDKKNIEPLFGSEVTGKIWLTENGQTIDRPPVTQDANYTSSVFDAGIPVTIIGIDPNAGSLNRTGSAPASTSRMDVLPGRLPYPITHLYASNVTGKKFYGSDATSPASVQTLDLSDGPVEFGLVYFGTREMPYVEIEVGQKSYGSDILFDSQVLCFADQKSSYSPSLPKIDGATKGEFYYQLEASAPKLTAGTSKRIRLDITARNTRNNSVLTDPLQRVQVLAWPVNNVQWLGGYSTLIEGGNFVDNADSDKTVLDKNYDQLTRIYSGKTDSLNQKMRIPTLAELDLIQGKGTIFFDYTGSAGNREAPSQLTFVVQPTTYAVDWTTLKSNPERLPYRTKQAIQIPDRPANLDVRTSSSIYNPMVSRTTSGFDLLYLNWQSNDDMVNGIYTVKSIPIDGSYTGTRATSWYWTWLWSLAIVQILGGAALIFQMRGKNGRR